MASNIEALYVEIDLPYCALEYGDTNAHGTCTASGTPCFNTRNNSFDCQDIPNYAPTTKTVRFTRYNGYDFWPNDGVPTFPILDSVSSRSAVLDPAETMGSRAKCSITLGNCQSLLAGLDKYIIARSESDYYTGSFLGKFKARNPYIVNSDVRVYRGFVGGVFDVEHYIIDGWSGPSRQSGMTIDCVDFLKLLNGDKSNYPPPSDGVLIADIDEFATSFSVQAGFGTGYPASGLVAIGNEAMAFTRIDDTFTVVRDGPLSLGKVEKHKAGETVQIVGQFSGQNSAQIINDLITLATPLDSSYIPIDDWLSEIAAFQSAVYAANIVTPTPVNKLINELCAQAGLIVWADVKSRTMKLKVLRPIGTAVSLDEDKIINFNQEELQDERVSQVWVRYNQKDPFKKLDDENNYYSRIIAPTTENLYPTEAIKKIYSRWIPSGGQSNAIDVASRQISRYKNPPRQFMFDLFISEPAPLGEGRIISARDIEDAFVNVVSAQTQIISSTPAGAIRRVIAKEFIFSDYNLEGGGSDIVVPIDGDFYENIDLKQYFLNSVRSSLDGVTSVTFVVKSGTVVGSYLTTLSAITIGDFESITPLLVVESGAFVVGRGGDGAQDVSLRNGGNALNADYPVSVQNNGTIGGGGGAGGNGAITIKAEDGNLIGFSGGCGGAGYRVGDSTAKLLYPALASGATVENGETTTLLNQNLSDINFEVIANNFGNGGDLGQAGQTKDTVGGAAGSAIKNNSNITWVSTGTILGAING